MGIFTQLGLLLQRYLIIRKRQPVILLLEVLWPLLIFVVVAVVRQGAPPTGSGTCRYGERALPNAGMLPFLQTYVCNMDNKCQDEKGIANSRARLSKLTGVVDELSPHLSNPKVLNGLKVLGNGTRLLEALDKGLGKETWLLDYLENGIPIRELLRDPDQLRKSVVEDNKYLDGDVFDTILNASLNIDGVTNLMGNVNLKDIVCDPKELRQYLVVSHAEEVSHALCSINASQVTEIFTLFQNNLDVVKIVKLLGRVIGEYTLDDAFHDIATLLDLIINSPVVKPLLKDLPQLFKLQGLISKIPQWVRGLEHFSTDGVDVIREMVMALDPIVSGLTNNSTIWNDIKSGVLMADNLLKMVFGGSSETGVLPFSSFFANPNEVELFLNGNGKPGTAILKTPVLLTQLTPYLFMTNTEGFQQQACSDPSHSILPPGLWFLCDEPGSQLSREIVSMVNLTVLKEQAFDKSLKLIGPEVSIIDNGLKLLGTIAQGTSGLSEELLNILMGVSSIRVEDTLNTLLKLFTDAIDPTEAIRMLTGYLSNVDRALAELPAANSTHMLMAIIDTTLSTITETINTLTGVEKYLRRLFTEDFHVVNAVNSLLALGPEVTQSVFKAFTDPKKLNMLIKDTKKIDAVFCDQAMLSQFLGIRAEPATLTKLRELFCQGNVSMIAKDIINELRLSEFEEIFRKGLEKINMSLTGSNGPLSFNISSAIWRSKALYDAVSRAVHMASMNWHDLVTGASHIHTNGTAWEKVWGDFQQDFWTAGVAVTVENWGPVLENSSLWESVGPYVRVVDVILKDASRQATIQEDLIGTNSSFGRLMTYFVDYAPEMIDALISLVENPRMISVLMSSPDVSSTMCDPEKVRMLMTVPDYVPLDDMVHAFCSIDLKRIGYHLATAFSMDAVNKQVADILENKNGIGTARGFDWAEMVADAQNMYKVFTGSIGSSPQLFMYNYTVKLHIALDRLWDKVQHMPLVDYSRLSALALGFGAQIDKEFSTDPIWRIVKHYIHLMIQYLADMNAKGGGSLGIRDLYPNATDLIRLLETGGEAVPDLLLALRNIITNPYKLMQSLVLLDPENVTLCGTLEVSSLLEVDDPRRLQQLEDLICRANWTAIAIQMGQDPRQQGYMNAIIAYATGQTVPDIDLDWRKVIGVVTEYFQHLGNMTAESALGLEEQGLNLTAISIRFDQLVNKTATTYMDPLAGVKSLAGSITFMEMLVSNEKDGPFTDIWEMEKIYLYIINQLLAVANENLPRLQGKDQINILHFLHSEELDKIAKALEASPDMVEALMDTALRVAQASQTLDTMAFLTLCDDPTSFGTLFPASAQSQYDLHAIVCNASLVNITKLTIELENSFAGLSHMIYMVSGVLHGNMTYRDLDLNGTALVKNYEEFMEIITDLVTRQPKLDLGINLQFANLTVWQDILDNYGDKLLSAFENIKLTSWEDVLKMEMTIMEQVLVPFLDRPEVNEILALVGYTARQATSAMEQLLERNVTDVRDFLIDYPTIQQVFHLSNSLPQILATLIYTNNYNPMALSMLIERSMSWEDFCGSNISDFIQNVPGLNFDMVAFTSELCELNTTKLTMEAEAFTGTTDLMSTKNITGDISTDRVVNIARMRAAVQDMGDLVRVYVDLFQAPPLHLPQVFSWLNESIWNATFYPLGTQLADPATLMRSLATLDGLIPLLDNLSRTDEFFGYMWKMEKTGIYIMNEFLMLANKNLPRLKGQLNLLDFFHSEELEKIATALKASPEIVKLLFDSILDIMADPLKSNQLSDPALLSGLCVDPGSFSKLFPESLTSRVDIQEVICNLTYINITRLINELEGGVYGLSQLMHSMTMALQPNASLDDLNVNYQSMAKNYALFQEILVNLTTSPPEVTFGSEPWTDPATWAQLWGNFSQDYSNVSQTAFTFGIVDIVERLLPIMEDQFKPLYQVEGFNTSLYMIAEVVGPALQVFRLEAANSTEEIYAKMSKYPEVEKVFHILDKVPFLINSALQPSVLGWMSELVNRFANVTSFEDFCDLNITDIFPGLPNDEGVSPQSIKDDICALNLTTIYPQLLQFFNVPLRSASIESHEGFDPINNASYVSVSIKYHVNITVSGLLADVLELSMRVSDSFGGPLPLLPLPMFNASVWNHWWLKTVGKYDFQSADNLLAVTTAMRANLQMLLSSPGADISPTLMGGLDELISYLTDIVRVVKVGKVPDIVEMIQNVPLFKTLNDLSKLAPDIVDVFVETMMDPVKSQYVLGLMSNPKATFEALGLTANPSGPFEAFCRLPELYLEQLFVRPPGSPLNLTHAQFVICSISSVLGIDAETVVNATANPATNSSGAMRLSSLASSFIGNLFTRQDGSSTANMSRFIDDIVSLYGDLVTLPYHLPNSSVFAQSNLSALLPFYDVFQPESWQLVINRLNGRFLSTPGSVLDLLESMRGVIGGLLADPATRDSTIATLKIVDDVMVEVTKSLYMLQEGKVYDLLSTFSGSRNIESLLGLMDQAPDLAEILIETVLSPVKSNAFVNLFTVAPGLAFQTFCNATDLNVYFKRPINSSVDMDAVRSTICELDILMLGEELANKTFGDNNPLLRMGMPDESNSSSYTEIFNETAFFQRVTDLQTAINTLAANPPNASDFDMNMLSRALPFLHWFDVGRWTQMLKRVVNRLRNRPPAELSSLADQLMPLIGLIPQDSTTLKLFKVITVELEVFLDKVDRLGNRTSFSLADLFPDSPNIMRLANFLDSNPRVIEALIYSLDKPQFTQLFSMSTEEAMRRVCGSPDQYLSLPGHQEALQKFVTEFCTINITVLAQEFEMELRLPELRSNSSFDMRSYIVVTQRLTEAVSRWVTAPPPQLTLTPQWTNATFWTDVLSDYASFLESNPALMASQQIQSVMGSILPLLAYPDSPIPAVFELIDHINRLVVNKLSLLAAGNLTLESLLSDAPRFRELLMSTLDIAPDMLDAVLTATMNNPDAFDRVITAPDWHSVICDRPGALGQVFALPSGINSTEVQRVVCSINDSLLISDFKNLVGYDELLENLAGLKNGTYQVDWQALIGRVDQLTTTIESLIRNPPSFQLPAVDTAALDAVAQKFMSGLTNSNGLSGAGGLLKIYNILDHYLQGTPGWKEVSAYYKASEIFLEYLNGVMGRLSVSGQQLNLAGLFGNSPRVRHLLDLAFNLGPDFLTGFLSATVNPAKLSGMVSGTVSLDSVVCSETEMRKYFVFHPSFNLSYAVSALCNINGSEIVSELMQAFDVQAIAQKLLDLENSTVKFDPLAYTREAEEFSNHLVRLLNTSTVVFGNVDLVKYLFHFNGSVDQLIQNSLGVSLSPNASDYATYLEMMMPLIEKTDFWSTVRPVLSAMNVMADWLTGKITAIETSRPLTLESLLKDAPVFSKFLREGFSLAPDILDAFMRSTVDSAKLQALIPPLPEYPDFSNMTLEELRNYTFPTYDPIGLSCTLDIFTLPSDVNDTAVRRVLCDINMTVWTHELKKEINYDQILTEIMKSGQNDSRPFDWKEFLTNIQILQYAIGQLPKANINVTSIPDFLAEFFSYHGDMQDWLHRLENAGYVSPTAQGFDAYAFLKTTANEFLRGVSGGLSMSSHESPEVSNVMTVFGKLLRLLGKELTAVEEGLANEDILGMALKNRLPDLYSLPNVSASVIDQFLALKFRPQKLLDLDFGGVLRLCDRQFRSEVFVLPNESRPALDEFLDRILCNESSASLAVQLALNSWSPTTRRLETLLRLIGQPDENRYNTSVVVSETIKLLDLMFVKPAGANYTQVSPALTELVRLLDTTALNAKLFAFGTNVFVSLLEKGSEASTQWQKVGQAFNLLVKGASSLLQTFTENPIDMFDLFNTNLKLYMLLPNDTADQSIFFDSILRGNLNLNKLSPLFSRSSGGQELCKASTFEAVFGLNASMSDKAHSILCNNPTELLEALRDAVGDNPIDLFLQIPKLFQPETPTPSVDWEGLYQRTDQLVRKLVEMLNLPQEMLMDKLLENWTGTKIDQMMGAGILPLTGKVMQVVSGLLPADASRFVYPILQYLGGPILREMEQQARIYQELMTANSSEAISDLFDFRKIAKLQIESLEGVDLIEALMCNVSMVSRMLPKRYLDPVNVSAALCQQPTSSWYTNLLQTGMGPLDVVAFSSTVVGEYLIQAFSSTHKSPALSSLDWEGFGRRLQSLVSGLTPPTQQGAAFDWDQLTTAIGEGSLQALSSTLDVLMFMDGSMNSASWNSQKTYIRLLADVFKITNDLLDRLTVANRTLSLANLFPDPSELKAVLNDAIEPDATAELLTASINPEKLLNMTKHLDVIACDPERFAQTFSFPYEVNVTAVQQRLCDAAHSNATFIHRLVGMMDMESVLQEVLRAAQNFREHSVLTGPGLWMYAKQQVQRFKENMQKLGQVSGLNMTETHDWWTNTQRALEHVLAKSSFVFGETCNAILPLINRDFYNEHIKPVLSGVMKGLRLMQQEAVVTNEFEDIVCDLPGMRLPGIINKLAGIGTFDLLENYLRVWDEDTKFDCKEASHILMDFNQASSPSSLQTILSHNRTFVCLHDLFFNQTQGIKDIDSIFSLMSDVLTVLQDRDVANFTALLGQDFKQYLPYVELFLKAVLGQKDVALSLSSIVANDTTAMDYFVDVLKFSPIIVDNLFKATLNVDIVSFFNNSAETVKNIFCDAGRLGEYIKLPEGTGLTVANLSTAVCTSNLTSAIEYVQTAMDLGKVAVQLSQAGSGGLNMTWFQGLASHISSLMGKIQSVSSLAAIDLNNVDYQKVLPEVQRLLKEAGPTEILNGIALIIGDFKSLTDSEVGRDVIDTLQVVTRGLVALRSISQYIIPNIEDLLVDPQAVRKNMTEVWGFSPEVADAILQSQISITLQGGGKNVSAVACVPHRLADILFLDSSSKVSLADVSQALCQMDTDTLAHFSQTVFRGLGITDLLDRFLKLSADSLLAGSGLDIKDAEAVFKELGEAQKDLMEASKKLSNLSDFESLLPTPEALTSSSGLSTASEFLCGRDTTLNDEFQLASVASPKKKDEGVLTEDQVNEINSMPTPFCQDVLRTMYTEAGNDANILWAYLKPLLFGKILFSPNTPENMAIVQKVNGTFELLAEVNRLAHAWTVGAAQLKDFVDSSKNLDNVLKMLESPLVSSLFEQTAGISGETIKDGLDQMNSVSSTMLDQLEYMAHLLANYTDCVVVDRFVGFDDHDEVFEEASRLTKSRTMMAALEFVTVGSDFSRKRREAVNTTFPKNVVYKIRMDIDNVPSTTFKKSRVWRPVPEDSFAMDLRYFRGFVQLQEMVDRAIIEIQTGSDGQFPEIYTKQFPFPCHEEDDFLHFLSFYLLPVMMTVAWIGSLGMAIKILMYDRERGLEETLKVMGLKGGVNWFAWLVVTLLFMILVSGLEVLILKVSGLFRFSNWFILLLYLVDFCLSSLMMCYMVSAFFTRANLAALSCLIFYLISYLPFVLVTSLEEQLTFTEKMLACLSSTTAFGFASQYMSRFEEQQIGVQWHNINTSPVENDPMNMSWACIMMVVDSAIYLIIGWYVRNIIPRKYGMRQPWYFPVTASYWGCGSKSRAAKYEKPKSGMLNDGFDGDILMEDIASKSQEVGISLTNLTKKYSGKHKAVDNLSVDFFKGQITSMLGHNGAGKTTTINMLSGVVKPSSGSAHVNNLDIYKDLSEIRKDIAICPQHNILFDFMTVKEHLEFYIGLKGNYSGKSAKEEVNRMLESVDMFEERDVPVTQLSGGMKRRLCVALAFVGGADTVILDEPTSGVDPSARRGVWDVILRNKNNRTIVLSTHHLDEADVLSDRIAVLHEGKLLCYGTPMFLKKQLGSGYHLRVAIETDSVSNSDSAKESEDSDTATGLLEFVRRYVPGAELQEETGNEVRISLPADDEEKQNFHRMFMELDNKSAELGIASYGISDTTLEEVFLKVCYLADNNKPLTPDNLRSWTHSNNSDKASSRGSDNDMARLVKAKSQRSRSSGLSMVGQQFAALFVKRFHHYRRDWRMLLTLIILPLLFVACAMGFAKVQKDVDQTPPIVLTPAMYEEPGREQFAFFKQESNSPMFDNMVSHMQDYPGFGTVCMPEMRKWKYISEKFDCEESLKNGFSPGSKGTANCTCRDSYRYGCEGKPSLPANNLTYTGVRLQDLHGFDVSSHILDSFQEFEGKRYGGWTYEDKNKAQVWFNNKGHHALPAFLNTLSNTILRTRLPAFEKPEDYGITTINHPYRLTSEALSRDTIMQKAGETGVALVILMAFSFVTASFIIYVVDERINKEKRMQYISGVSPLTYWLVALIWDMMVFAVTVGLAVLIMWIFRIPAFWERQNLEATVALLLMFGCSCTCMMYMMNKLFGTTSTAYMTLFCVNMLIGIITALTIFLLSFFQNVEVIADVYEILQYVFMIFPQYCLGEGLIRLTKNWLVADLYQRFGADAYQSPFDMDFLGWLLVAMAIQTVVFFIITLLTEIQPRPIFRNRKSKSSLLEDEDVKEERDRIVNGSINNNDLLVARDLSKLYLRGLKKVVAVDNLTFGVHKGECFGLLGVNGAGKTSTFKMLTGDALSSGGEAYLNGVSVRHLDSQALQSMGYCPQEDALDDFLSGRELLYCHARLKGTSAEEAERTITALSSSLDMDSFLDNPTKTYSGGMKRKLSLAIAVLGTPDIIYLDEPTAGMDPGNKRLAWNVILDLVKGGHSVILISHSMAECDILCNRIGIMVNGRFVCLGSPQHLKNKFSEGYRVIIKLKDNGNVHMMSEFMFNTFPGTQFKDHHLGTLEFAIPAESSDLANIFGRLERQKQELSIQDYSVQQTTLDAVFIHFARQQTDGVTASPDGSVTDTDLEMYKGSVRSNVGLSGPFVNNTYAFMNPQLSHDIEMKPTDRESGFYNDNLHTGIERAPSQRSEKAKLDPMYGYMASQDSVTHL